MDDGQVGESLPLSEYLCPASLSVSNAFNERPVGSAVFQENNHN